jgi:hypothetical protein
VPGDDSGAGELGLRDAAGRWSFRPAPTDPRHPPTRPTPGTEQDEGATTVTCYGSGLAGASGTATLWIQVDCATTTVGADEPDHSSTVRTFS